MKPFRTYWTIAAIIVVVLFIVMAMRVREHAFVGGAEESSSATTTLPHALGEAIHAARRAEAEANPPAAPPPPLDRRPLPVRVVGGKAAAKAAKPKKAWTSYETWTALENDPGAVDAYWADVNAVLGSLDLDWSGVRAELADKLYDDREWAGRINLVDGKPKIVELVPSPHAVGEGPLPRRAAAMVPAEVMARLEKKPALFIFHTHPGEGPGTEMPSPTDVAGALWMAYTQHYAADLMVSPYGVFMYGPNAAFRAAIWADKSPDKALLALYRRAADVLAAMEGSRSWTSPWTLEDYATMLRRYDVEYVAFPTDKYARADQRTLYSTPSAVDLAQIRDYHERIQELEAAEAQPRKRAKKRVRFADPLTS